MCLSLFSFGVTTAADEAGNPDTGNKNELFITVTERFDNGTTNVITAKFMIDNNAEGTYQVGPYKVFVNTKGNTQIRDIYIR